MSIGGYPSAHALLDAVARGAQVRDDLIVRALEATGDLPRLSPLERLGRDYSINFTSPAARATLESFQ